MAENYSSFQTKYGVIKGISSIDFYKNGMIKECSVEEENTLDTPLGHFIPQYGDDGVRHKFIKSLAFYDNGNIKKIALHEQNKVMSSIGEMDAELVMFYENGNIKRIFPLNGKITGYWTEDNEFELAKPTKFKLSFAEFEKKIINVQFYEEGSIKSITFWPKELLTIQMPFGKIGIRYGMGLYKDGNIKSIEPAFPIIVNTPVGKISAFDVNAIGINGDNNSLNFYEDGSIKSLLTTTDVIILSDDLGNRFSFEPGLRPSMLDEDGMDIVPLKLEFFDDKVRINENDETTYSINKYNFVVKNNTFKAVNKCGSCASCTGCS